MSSATNSRVKPGAVDRLVGLIRRYIRTLRVDMAQASAAHERWGAEKPSERQKSVHFQTLQALDLRLTTLRPALERLDRVASQFIEHVKLDDVERVELEVAVADLESTMQLVESHVHGLVHAK